MILINVSLSLTDWVCCIWMKTLQTNLYGNGFGNNLNYVRLKFSFLMKNFTAIPAASLIFHNIRLTCREKKNNKSTTKSTTIENRNICSVRNIVNTVQSQTVDLFNYKADVFFNWYLFVPKRNETFELFIAFLSRCVIAYKFI